MCKKRRKKGFACVKDSLDTLIRWLEVYIKKMIKGKFVTVARNSTSSTKINTPTIARKLKWEEKQLYGYFKGKTSKISLEKTWYG